MIKPEIEKILLKVQKPARYISGEYGSVVKDKSVVNLRIAFCFPDVYEVGMSHLGMRILYSLYNNEADTWCERVFAPWTDMEDELRKRGIPLYALESGDPLSDFDIIAFTLQYELSYTNILNMLDLGGIPLRSEQRTELSQLVIAGGPCAYNPEPLADFVDVFLLGEGEEMNLEFNRIYLEAKEAGITKREFLERAANIEGAYVPVLSQKTVRKRIVKDMDTAFYPKDLIVPYLDIVHDRVVQEIFRGCIRGCRFCQAGFVYRPVREKSVGAIDSQARTLCQATGYDEISLSSLSTGDYSELSPLMSRMIDWTSNEKISLAVPSMRIDAFDAELTKKLSAVRRAGLTFAPEAGTQRLRDAINKKITEEEILATCERAFSGGWTTVKLYFMLGLPGETDEDVEGIAALVKKVVDTFYSNKRRPKGKQLRITVSASGFVPKPFTPFQWEPQDSISELERKQRLLKNAIQSKKVTLNYHDAHTSFVEAVFARGDRKLSAALELAQKKGLKFDGWTEFFSLTKWMEVFDEAGIDPNVYVRRRDYSEQLPWDGIDIGVTKDFLISEAEKARAAITTCNCRESCQGCGANIWETGVCYETH